MSERTQNTGIYCPIVESNEKQANSFYHLPRITPSSSALSDNDVSSGSDDITGSHHHSRPYRRWKRNDEVPLILEPIQHQRLKEKTFVIREEIPISIDSTSLRELRHKTARELQRRNFLSPSPPSPTLPWRSRSLATRSSPRQLQIAAGSDVTDKGNDRHDVANVSSPSQHRKNFRSRRVRRHQRRYDAEFPLGDISTDKPVASQAVAFVIRASRRGVVPLCAEVANLFKENSNLEEIVTEQKRDLTELQEEVQALRLLTKGPPPVMKDFCFQTIQEVDCQTMTVSESEAQTEMMKISCVRIENMEDLRQKRPTSSRISDRSFSVCQKFGKFPGVEASCGSDVVLTCSCAPLVTQSTQNPTMVSIGVNTSREGCMDSELGYFEHNSLEKSHRELEKKHSEVVDKHENIGKVNDTLNTDLNSAKKEIVSLQTAIQGLQNKEYDRAKEEERLRYDDTYSVDVQKTWNSSDEESAVKQRLSKTASGNRPIAQLLPLLTTDTPSGSRSSTARSSIFPGPILGCKCQMCTAFFRSSGILGFACSPYVTDSSGKNPVLRDLRRLVWLQNSKLQIQPKDQVIARNNRMGTVRYVGHLDGVGTPSVVYIGLELENQDGRHDGYLHGKRYFFCPHKHGLFIPLQDIICVINRKVTPPTAHPPIRRRQHAITGVDSRGRVASVALSEFRKRNRMKSSSDTSESSTTDVTSSTSSSRTERSESRERFPPVTVK